MAKAPEQQATDPRAPIGGERNDDPARQSRATNDRGYQDMTLEQRFELFRAHTTDSILPMPKAPEGWHYIYLSTTNQYDTIQTRMQWGYIPVTPEEVPGWAHRENVISDGAYSGMVGVKEMVLFKIEEELYQKMMRHLHHDLPNLEAQKLLDLTKSPNLADAGIAGDVDVRRDVGSGERETEELIKRKAAPRRFG